MIISNKAEFTPPKKEVVYMWFAFVTVLLILGQKVFLPPYPYTGQFDTDEEEYDYR